MVRPNGNFEEPPVTRFVLRIEAMERSRRTQIQAATFGRMLFIRVKYRTRPYKGNVTGTTSSNGKNPLGIQKFSIADSTESGSFERAQL
jgi:hypothetical protein